MKTLCLVLAALVVPSIASACDTSFLPPADALDAAYADRTAVGARVSWPVPNGVASPSVVETGCSFRVNGVDGVPGFEVTVRAPDPIPPTQAIAPSSGMIFVMADTHGEYTFAAQMLANAGVMDENLDWTFGTGAVIVLGDVLDRGAHQTELLWLLYKLQGEATAAGGQLHLLLGNHEAMVLSGDLRYLNTKYSVTAERLGKSDYTQVLGPETVLGQWLRTRSAILRIEEDLFVHGGLSPEYAATGATLEGTNDQIRAAIAGLNAGPSSSTGTGPIGPLWYRGYIAHDNVPVLVTTEQVEAVLSHFGGKRIFVGHTVVPEVASLLEGQVIAVQVYPHVDEAGRPVMESVLIENGSVQAVNIEGVRRRLS